MSAVWPAVSSGVGLEGSFRFVPAERRPDCNVALARPRTPASGQSLRLRLQLLRLCGTEAAQERNGSAHLSGLRRMASTAPKAGTLPDRLPRMRSDFRALGARSGQDRDVSWLQLFPGLPGSRRESPQQAFLVTALIEAQGNPPRGMLDEVVVWILRRSPSRQTCLSYGCAKRKV